MEEAIKKLATQFNFVPTIQNAAALRPATSFVLGGMGGSHLSADLLKIYDPRLNIHVHHDYGLPHLSDERFGAAMFIASSYSGNTEEVLDFAEKALAKKYNLVVVGLGGHIIAWAQQHGVPYIQLPDTGIQPRSAVGFSIIALAKLMSGDAAVAELAQLGTKLSPLKLDTLGQKLADELRGKVPIIYSSPVNLPIAYNWKIKFNETAKIPAFCNMFSELNHNEMTGFDVVPSTRPLSERMHFIFLADTADNRKITLRMHVTKKMYEDRGFGVSVIEIAGDTVFEKIFNTLTIADWAALHLARLYGTEPDAVPMVEEFKKLIAVAS